MVTLIPANGAPGVVPAEGRLTPARWDIGGPAPEGFWIFAGGQRTLNVAAVRAAGRPAGVLAAPLGRRRWVLVPLGFAALALFSVGLEPSQLALARLDRACDVTDVIDNVTGAAIGVPSASGSPWCCGRGEADRRGRR